MGKPRYIDSGAGYIDLLNKTLVVLVIPSERENSEGRQDYAITNNSIVTI
jgi:hypothetical protein